MFEYVRRLAVTVAVTLAVCIAIPSPVQAKQKTLVFGMSAAFTGANAELGIEFYRGAMAWFSHVNAKGGVHGMRLAIRSANDGYNPDPCFFNTVEFMKSKDIFSLLCYVGTPTTTRILPLLELYKGKDMLLLFPMTGAQPLREEPYGQYVYSLRASYRQETAGLVKKLLETGRNRIAVFYQADAYGRSGWDGVRRALASYGLGIEAEASYTRGLRFDASYEEQAAILFDANPDAVICIGTYSSCSGFVRDARDRGYGGVIAAVSFANSDKMLELLTRKMRENGKDYLEDLLFSQVVPSPYSDDLPAVRQYRRHMAEYRQREMTGGRVYSYASLEGFLSARLVTEAVRRMGPQPDRARFRKALTSLDDFDLGIGMPLRFGPERTQGLNAVYFSTFREGMQETVSDWQRWRQ